jgi:glycosyltransferase involved in cell wall biosynthesis
VTRTYEHHVSVLTPSYGYGRFIGDAVTSVRLQRGIDVEHIVQDGGSKDETVQILRRVSDHGLVWSSEPDRGQSDALNRALAKAKGDLVGWLNADEFYVPCGLSRLVQTLSGSGADVVFGDCIFVDSAGGLLRLLPGHPYNRLVLRTYGAFIASCATLFRRSVLDATPWNPNVERVLDWDLYLRLAEEGARFAYLPYPVGAFRVHPARITAASREHHATSYQTVARLHNLSGNLGAKWMGRIMHMALKGASGGYMRQLKAGRLRGTDMRWFSGHGEEGISLLLRLCYGSDQER